MQSELLATYRSASGTAQNLRLQNVADMPYPTKYARQYDFASYQVSNPTRPLPGDRVNYDLNAVWSTS
jgi:hypothetical protein